MCLYLLKTIDLELSNAVEFLKLKEIYDLSAVHNLHAFDQFLYSIDSSIILHLIISSVYLVFVQASGFIIINVPERRLVICITVLKIAFTQTYASFLPNYVVFQDCYNFSFINNSVYETRLIKWERFKISTVTIESGVLVQLTSDKVLHIEAAAVQNHLYVQQASLSVAVYKINSQYFSQLKSKGIIQRMMYFRSKLFTTQPYLKISWKNYSNRCNPFDTNHIRVFQVP